MVHADHISSLLEGLIKAQTDSPSKTQTEHYKAAALQIVSNSPRRRINQFEVTARLEGLVEKCRILNKDPMADALQTKLDELSLHSNKWKPELLSLLLNLSDQPIHNSRVEDLVLLEPDLGPAPLTWFDIIAEDPLDDDDGLWTNIDFRADGSDEDDDEDIGGEGSGLEDHTPDSGIENDGIGTNVQALLLPVEDKDYREIVDAQFWKQPLKQERRELSKPFASMTELQALREVTFMLLGLPTFICTRNSDGVLTISQGIRVRHIPQQSLEGLLKSFADTGHKLVEIRHWVRKKAFVHLEQTFQTALSSRLRSFDSHLYAVQAKILDPARSTTPSLLDLLHDVCHWSRLLQQLHVTVKALSQDHRRFHLLEHLYEQVCRNQSVGDTEGYEYMANIFFECFGSYLKPIRLWMETGQLNKHDQVMFIQKNEKNEGEIPMNSLWQDQYSLIHDANGHLHAPKFLHLAAHTIFNTGKSVNFLKLLGYEQWQLGVQSYNEPTMSFESVCSPATQMALSPFSEVFDIAIDRWISSKYRLSSTLLREQIETQCGLQRSLDALEYIYFFRNGAVTNSTTFPLFERIDRRNGSWNDSFVLTELFQGAFARIPCIDVQRLDVRTSAGSYPSSQHKNRSMSVLESLRITYTLPWPVANIITANSKSTYNRIFIFLTQLQRAKYLLERQKPSTITFTQSLYGFRHRLLYLTNTLLTHFTTLVLSVNISNMRASLTRVEDVDAMIAVHETHILQLEDQCLLSPKHAPVRQAIISMLDLAVLFSDALATYTAGDSAGKASAKPGRRRASSLSSDDEEDDDGRSDRDVLRDTVAIDKISGMQDTFAKLLSFVAAAVQGISKADGSVAWDVLASNLAWGVGR